jgi:hypothetical protein
MARARNIKPSIMANEDLSDLAPLTRLLFVYLWMLADREGRLEDRPKRIAALALPYDRAADVGAMLDELQSAGFIARYVAAGQACIQVLTFREHQTPHIREAASALPEYGQGTFKAVLSTSLGQTEPSPRSPEPGFSDSLIPESGLGTAAVPATPSAKKQKTAMQDSFAVSDRVRAWAKTKGYGMLEQHLESLRSKCAANGYKKLSWDDFLMEAIREDWAKLRGRGANGAAPGPDVIVRPEVDPALAKIAADRARAVPPPPGFFKPRLKQGAHA